MRFLGLALAPLALGALLAAPSLAGEDARSLTGFDCENLCPLAHRANELRALGSEGLAVASRVQADLAARVTANLRRI